MGYEVLGVGEPDLRADAARTSTPHVHDLQVVALEPDETWRRVADTEPSRDRRPSLWSAGAWVDRWHRVRTALPHARPGGSTRALVAVVASALVVGLFAGGLFTRQHERAVQAEADRGVAMVTGELASLDDGGRTYDRTLSLTVRLLNLGPLPVSLVTTGPAARPTPEAPRVRVSIGSNPQVGAGGTLLASVTARMDCDSGHPAWPRVQVRSGNGQVHDVRLLESGMLAGSPEGYCSMIEQSSRTPLAAELVGSLSRPVVRVTNPSRQSAQVLPVLNEATDMLVAASFRPAGPQEVAAGQTKSFAMDVRVARCETDVAQRTQAQSSNSYLEVRVLSTGNGSPDATGVDVGAVIGAHLERACAGG